MIKDVTDIVGNKIFADSFMFNAINRCDDEFLLDQYGLTKSICYKVLKKYPGVVGFLGIDTYKYEVCSNKDIRDIIEHTERKKVMNNGSNKRN